MIEEYICSICGFIYDEESAPRSPEGIIIPFEDVDNDFTCPNCGVNQDMFVPVNKEAAKINKHLKNEYKPGTLK